MVMTFEAFQQRIRSYAAKSFYYQQNSWTQKIKNWIFYNTNEMAIDSDTAYFDGDVTRCRM